VAPTDHELLAQMRARRAHQPAPSRTSARRGSTRAWRESDRETALTAIPSTRTRPRASSSSTTAAGYDGTALADLLQELPDLDGTGYDDSAWQEQLAGLQPPEAPAPPDGFSDPGTG
jgi:hypothetical protein